MSYYTPPSDYAHLLGIADPADVPSWLPDASPGFLDVASGLDATRVGGRYTDASVAFVMGLEPWNGRPLAVLWVLFRALLGQPGGGRFFKPEVVGGLRWSVQDALWVTRMTPVGKPTSHLILAALDCIYTDDLVLTAATVAGLRDVVTDPAQLERLDALDARIAALPKVEDVLDPRFVERIFDALNSPIRELLLHCAIKRPARPAWWWRDRMKSIAKLQDTVVRDILAAIPPHLEEHGGFTQGEDTLRGLVFVAEAFEKGWVVPLLADVILAAGGTSPPRSVILANASVEALYYRPKAVGVLRDLEGKVPGKALKKRIASTVKYMQM